MLDQPDLTQGSIRNEHSFSYPMYKDFRDHNHVFSGVLARFPVPVSVGYHGQTERAEGEIVSGNYFEVLGVLSAYRTDFHSGRRSHSRRASRGVSHVRLLETPVRWRPLNSEPDAASSTAIH